MPYPMCICMQMGFPWWLSSEESACKAGDAGAIPGSGRCPGAGHGKLFQYSCLENPMAWGAWWATVHRVAKSQTWLKQLSMHMCMQITKPGILCVYRCMAQPALSFQTTAKTPPCWRRAADVSLLPSRCPFALLREASNTLVSILLPCSLQWQGPVSVSLLHLVYLLWNSAVSQDCLSGCSGNCLTVRFLQLISLK